jgi:NADH-quinone oxidoreductase subunit N
MQVILPQIPNMSLLMPEILLTVLACLIFIVDIFVSKENKSILGWLGIAGLIGIIFYSFGLWGKNEVVFSGMYAVDKFSVFLKILLMAVTAITFLISLRYLKVEDINMGEYYGLILTATLGMIIMSAGNYLITIYLGLELMSLSIYVLSGFIRRDPKSQEAALKYFLLGAFTSGLLLYGIALLYGITGSTNLNEIAKYLTDGNITYSVPLILSMVLLVTGFGFKISFVPFHMWVPDVYEGAPTSITAYMSVGTKIAGFAALMRIFLIGISILKPHWIILLWVLSVMTMTIGNFVAIAQKSLKRMLAYSSIAHAGYILIGFIAGNEIGLAGMLYYFVAYMFMNIAAFTMIILLCREGNRGDQISDFQGMATTNPVVALAFVVIFMSLAGIPPTAGFVGKLYIFAAAIQTDYIWLLIIAVVNSAISVYYYFSVVMAMYMKEPDKEIIINRSPALTFSLILMVVGIIALGVYPGPFIDAAKASIIPFLEPLKMAMAIL